MSGICSAHQGPCPEDCHINGGLVWATRAQRAEARVLELEKTYDGYAERWNQLEAARDCLKRQKAKMQALAKEIASVDCDDDHRRIEAGSRKNIMRREPIGLQIYARGCPW